MNGIHEVTGSIPVRSTILRLSTPVLAFCLMAAPDSSAFAQTSVSLGFRGPLDEPVTIMSAQLLVTAWGVSDEHALPIQGNIVRLDLDATRPEFADRFSDLQGFVYVKAKGYAPIMSQAFKWPGKGARAVIDFRNGRRVTIAPGSKASLNVTVRRPRTRHVRLVDLQGRAVAGARMEAAAYWDTPSHCGFMNGRDVLASGSTDRNGSMAVPDIDGPYAFSLLERDMLFADGNNYYHAGFDRQGLVTSLRRSKTTLRVRRYKRQRLALQIVSKGKPVPGAVLWADMQLGVCGAGSGPLATADSLGRISVDPFYREPWRDFWVCAGNEQIWVLPDDGKLPARIDVGVTPGTKPNRRSDVCRK